MTTAYDVPAKDLIAALTKKLHEETAIVPPDWSKFVRTGVSKENPPETKDWWHIRCASILRKLYLQKSIGVERLRAEYGGSKNKGSKPNKAKQGSGAIVRHALQQLETAGYVTKMKGKGRMLTPKGVKVLDNTSYEVKQSLLDTFPALKKY
ncbi:MAG: 30S ribosomal protein S19e [Candidatus Thermoplasmatota archaeon]|nr:30S ribosomal protein S19e [Candidatus Thermoplasmatota archaeon]